MALAHSLTRNIPVPLPHTTLRLAQGSQIAVAPTNMPSDIAAYCGGTHQQAIQGLYNHDQLDPAIGIWPRNKSSDEIQLLLSKGSQATKAAERPFLPEAMRKIIHQFMVANKYVGSGKHLPDKKAFQHSLMARLDLHHPLNSYQKQRFDGCKGAIFTHVMTQTLRWKETGIITHWFEGTIPLFHSCVEGWTQRHWNGEMPENVADTLGAPQSTQDTLAALAEPARFAFKKNGGDLEGAMCRTITTPSRANSLAIQRSPEPASTVFVEPRDLVTAFPRAILNAHDTDDSLDEEWNNLTRSCHDKKKNRSLDEHDKAERGLGQRFQFATTRYEVRGQYYYRSQTTAPSYMQRVENVRQEETAQGVSRLADSSQPVRDPYIVVSPFIPQAHSAISQWPVGQSYKRPMDVYSERPEPKRHCSVTQPPTTDPSIWTDLTRRKDGTTQVRVLPNVDDKEEKNVLQGFDTTGENQILRRSGSKDNRHSIQEAADTNHTEVSRLPTSALQNSTFGTQFSFSGFLSNLSHTRTTLCDFAPASLSEFVAVSRNWDPSRAKTSCLSETLIVCRDHLSAMGKYFESAIELVEISLRPDREEGK